MMTTAFLAGVGFGLLLAVQIAAAFYILGRRP